MALQKDTISIPLLKGIDTKIDPQQEQVGSLTKLRDVKFTKVGSIEKRYGYEIVSKEISHIIDLDNDIKFNLIDPLAVRGAGDTPVVITKNMICKYTTADRKTYTTSAYTPLHFQELPRPNDNDIHVNSQTQVFGDMCYGLHTRIGSGGQLVTYIEIFDISTPTPSVIAEPHPLVLNMSGTAFPNSVDGGSTFGAFSHTDAQTANGKMIIHEGRLVITVTDTSGNLFFKSCDPYNFADILKTSMAVSTDGRDGGWIPVNDGALNNTFNVYDLESDDDGIVLLMTKTSGSFNTVARKYGTFIGSSNSDSFLYFGWSYGWGWTMTATAVACDRVKKDAPSNYYNNDLSHDVVLTMVDDNEIIVVATGSHFTKNYQWSKTLTAGITGARFVSVVVNDNLFPQDWINASTTTAANFYFDVFVQYRKTGNPASATIDHIQFKDNTGGTNVGAFLTTNNFDSGTLDDIREGDWSTVTYASLEPWVTDYIVAWEFIPDYSDYSVPIAETVMEDYKIGLGIAGRPFQIRWGEDDQRKWDSSTVEWASKSGQWVQPFSIESQLGSAFYFMALAGPYNNYMPPRTTSNIGTGLNAYSRWTGLLAYGVGGGDLETGTAGVPSLSAVPYYRRNGNESVLFPYTVQSRVTTEDVSSEAAAYTAFYNTESATISKISYDPGIPNQSKEVADSLFIPGGMISKYQAGTTHEAGFLQAPHRLYLYLGGTTPMTEVSTASPTFAKGNIYNYVAVYSDRDSSGRVDKSSLSKQLQVTITNTSTNTGYDGVNLLIPMNVITNRYGSGIHDIEVYRTTNNGTVFHKVSGQDSTLSNPYLINQEQNYFIAFRDTITDDDLTNNELLYTTGGVLENTPAPACSIMEVYKNILFLAGLENPYAVQYTKEVGYNTALDFNDTLLFETPTIGGPITTLRGMDDKLFIFKSSSIYFIAGGQNNFTSYLRTKTGQVTDIELAILSADIGCVNKNSCVLTPIGIMFKSNRGIYLVNRSNMTLEYIGAPVQAYNNLEITDATLYAKVGEVRFITKRAETLVYNYERDVWYTFTGVSGNSQTVINDELFMVSDRNLVLKEVEDTYTDVGSPITIGLETGWMSFSKVQGFQRVYRMLILGKYKSKHQIKVRVAYDFDDTWVDEYIVETTDSDAVYWSSNGLTTPDGVAHDEMFSSEFYGGPVDQVVAGVTNQLPNPLTEQDGSTNFDLEGQEMPGVIGDPATSYLDTGEDAEGFQSYTVGEPQNEVVTPNPLTKNYSANQLQYQFRINMKKQKCEAIKVSIETLQDSKQSGEGATFSNISFLVGIKGGDFRIKQSRVKGVQ